uniref:Exocyst complex component 8 n=1 Tax=Ceriodaphnia reticulata TaxID=302197 RepID=A0A4Y7LTD3_9CRUS|nr:EOG090X021B [Ceriodaphnia reticulata]SVE72797.1 EOG090X021B [Ceriodaphnia reticulata]
MRASYLVEKSGSKFNLLTEANADTTGALVDYPRMADRLGIYFDPQLFSYYRSLVRSLPPIRIFLHIEEDEIETDLEDLQATTVKKSDIVYPSARSGDIFKVGRQRKSFSSSRIPVKTMCCVNGKTHVILDGHPIAIDPAIKAIDYPLIERDQQVQSQNDERNCAELEIEAEARRKRILLGTLSRLKKDHSRAKKVAQRILNASSSKNQDVDSDDGEIIESPKKMSHVKELTQQCVGGHDLQQHRQKIQALSEETNQYLKKNVYQNYMQFIETAKEISYLESEMYQLSHLLTEQRSLIVTLLENSLLGDKAPGLRGIEKPDTKAKFKTEVAVNLNVNNQEGRKRLTALLEKVEGCANVVESLTRTLIHEGDMVELDPSDNCAIGRVRGFLLNDSFMIASWLPNKRGNMRYQYQALYELEGLAVINIRDLGPVKYAFKLMMFPDTRVLQCANSNDKKEWLEAFDLAKQLKTKKEANLPAAAEIKDNSYDDAFNPFAEDESLPYIPNGSGNNAEVLESIPDSVAEVADDMDVYVAQRDFEEAVSLAEKTRSFWDSASPSVTNLHRDLKLKIDSRIRQLSEVLMNELRVTPEKSLQGGPRAASRAVLLLSRLGQASQACDLFLKHRSALLKHNLRQLKTEGATTLYIKRITSLFFPFVVETGREISRVFPKNKVCASAFVVWSRNEVGKFGNNFRKHVFTSGSTLTTVAECVSLVRGHSEQLVEIGLDLTFYLESELRAPVERCLRDAREKLMESIKLRALEDKWRPVNLVNKNGIARFADDMNEIGIASIHSWVYDECWVALTSNTINFSKAYLTFLDDALKLPSADSNIFVDEILHDIFQAQLKHVENSLRSGKYKGEVKFIHKNASFLLHTVLSLAQHRVEEVRLHPSPSISKLRSEFEWLANENKKISSTTIKSPASDPSFI